MPCPAHNKALHRTAIPLRSIAAGELGRWQFDLDGERLEIMDLLLVTPQTKSSWDSKNSVDWEGGTLKVLTPKGLIMLKSLRKSGQDIDDIEYLKELIDED